MCGLSDACKGFDTFLKKKELRHEIVQEVYNRDGHLQNIFGESKKIEFKWFFKRFFDVDTAPEPVCFKTGKKYEYYTDNQGRKRTRVVDVSVFPDGDNVLTKDTEKNLEKLALYNSFDVLCLVEL